MAKGKKKKKVVNNRLKPAADVDMKVIIDNSKPQKIAPASLDELIELAQHGAVQQSATKSSKTKQAPRGKRSKVQKQRKVGLLEKALASGDKADAKVAKSKSKAKKKAILSNLW